MILARVTIVQSIHVDGCIRYATNDRMKRGLRTRGFLALASPEARQRASRWVRPICAICCQFMIPRGLDCKHIVALLCCSSRSIRGQIARIFKSSSPQLPLLQLLKGSPDVRHTAWYINYGNTAFPNDFSAPARAFWQATLDPSSGRFRTWPVEHTEFNCRLHMSSLQASVYLLYRKPETKYPFLNVCSSVVYCRQSGLVTSSCVGSGNKFCLVCCAGFIPLHTPHAYSVPKRPVTPKFLKRLGLDCFAGSKALGSHKSSTLTVPFMHKK